MPSAVLDPAYAHRDRIQDHLIQDHLIQDHLRAETCWCLAKVARSGAGALSAFDVGLNLSPA